MWGHQGVGITPDIVTLEKPMRDGHPIAGVVTSMATVTERQTTN